MLIEFTDVIERAKISTNDFMRTKVLPDFQKKYKFLWRKHRREMKELIDLMVKT